MKDNQRRAMFAQMKSQQTENKRLVSHLNKDISEAKSGIQRDEEEIKRLNESILLANKENVCHSDNKRYNVFYQKSNGKDYSGNELLRKSKNEKDIILANKPVLAYRDEVENNGEKQYTENYGSLTDFGYDRKSKKYFVQLERVDYPASIGMTGKKTFRRYFTKDNDIELYRVKKEYK